MNKLTNVMMLTPDDLIEGHRDTSVDDIRLGVVKIEIIDAIHKADVVLFQDFLGETVIIKCRYNYTEDTDG